MNGFLSAAVKAATQFSEAVAKFGRTLGRYEPHRLRVNQNRALLYGPEQELVSRVMSEEAARIIRRGSQGAAVPGQPGAQPIATQRREILLTEHVRLRPAYETGEILPDDEHFRYSPGASMDISLDDGQNWSPVPQGATIEYHVNDVPRLVLPSVGSVWVGAVGMDPERRDLWVYVGEMSDDPVAARSDHAQSHVWVRYPGEDEYPSEGDLDRFNTIVGPDYTQPPDGASEGRGVMLDDLLGTIDEAVADYEAHKGEM